MTGGEVHHNAAGNQGAAFRIPSNLADCFFTMTGGSIHDNFSGTDGGALDIGDGGGTNVTKGNVTVDISGGEIYNNHTDGMGGAICSVWRNYKFIESGKTYTMNVNISGDVKLYNNTASQGGAVYLAYANLNMTGGEMYNNSVVPGSFSYVVGKSKTGTTINTETINVNSPGEGGAIYAANGNVTIDGTAKLHDNSAEGRGGALYISPQATNRTDLKGGTIMNNSAGLGGGLCTDATDAAKGNCYLYDNLKLSGNTIKGASPTAGSDLATIASDAYFTLGEDVTYGPISVQRGTAGHMIDLNGHKYNDNLALPGITLTGDGSDGVFALCGDGWVNVVHALRDNGSTGGGNSSVLDYPTSLASDTRLSGDVTDNTLHQEYGLAYSRTGRQNSYGTVMVPFTPSIYANVKLYSVTAVTDEGLVLREVAVAQPNVPYIYRITSPDADGHTYSMYLATNQNLNMDLSTIHDGNYIAHAGSGTQLIGRYVTDSSIAGKMGTTDNGIYYLKDDRFSHSTGTITVNPYRAYLKVTPLPGHDSPARSELPLVFDETADGIPALATVIDILRTEFFTLDGRRVAAPLRGVITLRIDHYSDGTVTTRKTKR